MPTTVAGTAVTANHQTAYANTAGDGRFASSFGCRHQRDRRDAAVGPDRQRWCGAGDRRNDTLTVNGTTITFDAGAVHWPVRATPIRWVSTPA